MTSVHWRSEALDELRVLVRPSRPGETCGIFHLDIADVDVDGLGAVWHENKPFDAAELSCGHVFHACALAVHCLANDMRCPVCRSGPSHRAQVSSFAPAMQPALLAKKNGLLAAAANEEAANDLDVDLDVNAIARGLSFEIYMQWAPAERNGTLARSDAVARLETPLQLVDNPDTADAPPAEHLDHYATHRSFQRKFNLHFKQMQPRGNVMCLGLSHPLMLDVVRSSLFDKAALLAYTENSTRIPLSGDIGFVLPRRTEFGVQLTLHLNTSFICMTCVQNLVDLDDRMRV